MLNIIEHKRVPFWISGVVFVASLIALITLGLKPGIDFTGGSLMEVRFTEMQPSIEEIKTVVDPVGVNLASVQPTDNNGYLLKMGFMTEDQHQDVLNALRTTFETPSEVQEEIAPAEEVPAAQGNRVLEERLETIGPVISQELTARSWEAGIVVLVAIVLFVAYSFRKVSHPVSSWKFGITAIIALIHDVVITMGVFALLGHFKGVEIDIPFVVAMLTILGYSVNDTIVVFDRIREKLIARGRGKFAETVAKGVQETMTRSINTSVTTLIVLLALFIFGGATIHYFALALVVGIILGTYSSLFLASPLLVTWKEMHDRQWKK